MATQQSSDARRAHTAFGTVDPDQVQPLTLVLVRHGVTEETVKRLLTGSSEAGPGLNAAGRVQAAKAADAVYGIGRRHWEQVPRVSRVLASPMTRAFETGTAIGRRLGITVEAHEGLREIDFGEWHGLSGTEIQERYGDDLHEWRFGRLAPPGGESIPEVGARLDRTIRELAGEHAQMAAAGEDAPRAWVLASHAVAIKSAIGISLDMDEQRWGSIWPQPASYTIIEMRVAASGEIVERHLLCMGVAPR